MRRFVHIALLLYVGGTLAFWASQYEVWAKDGGDSTRTTRPEVSKMRKSPFGAITPSAEVVAKNDDVRRVLREQASDDGQAERLVRHFLYPLTLRQKNHEQVTRKLEQLGFLVSPTNANNGLIAEEYREIASADFDGLTAAFEQWAGEHGWEYDGWECVPKRHGRAP